MNTCVTDSVTPITTNTRSVNHFSELQLNEMQNVKNELISIPMIDTENTYQSTINWPQNDETVQQKSYYYPPVLQSMGYQNVSHLSNDYNTCQTTYTESTIEYQNYANNEMNDQNQRMTIQDNYYNSTDVSKCSAMMDTESTSDGMTSMTSIPSNCIHTYNSIIMNSLNSSINKQNIQFMKTIEFLRTTDLLHLTLQTADLMYKNLEIQNDINATKQLLSL
ncbi:uncharacterized protein LOC128952479 [Oppia nitens]|uniref:uncharacterized protein LOC128952479 n=1 Tax=Oppia nitens TaxID=1686743 RepID=UPI0023DB611C|nr:uncharacterized protein LOC128952479 [Oppia nitens]